MLMMNDFNFIHSKCEKLRRGEADPPAQGPPTEGAARVPAV